MPIYEYECKDCNHQFEAIRKISDGPPAACPSCGRDALQKLVSKAAFRLKGTGWYETDFKTKKEEKKADPSKKSGDGEGKKSDDTTKSDSKPTATTSETKKSASKSDD